MSKRIRYCDECRCDREVIINERPATYTFRNEPFDIIEQYAECPEGHDVSDEELDTNTLQQLSKLYEIKHSFNSEMLRAVRQSFNLSQALFAKVVGMGIASIKRYELGGSSPDPAQIGIYKLLKSNPRNIKQFFLQNKGNLSTEELIVVTDKISTFLNPSNEIEETIERFLEMIYKDHDDTWATGYSKFKAKKLFQMILFFSRNGVLKTKLMKLLWYTDFLSFKRTKVPISGTPYWHLPFGPVPKKHEFILGTLQGLELISIKEEESTDGYTRMTVQANESCNPDTFTEDEWNVLLYVDEFFKEYGSRAISNFAHSETAWLETVDEQIIPYQYADNLQLS